MGGYDSVQYNSPDKDMSGRFCTTSEHFFPEKKCPGKNCRLLNKRKIDKLAFL